MNKTVILNRRLNHIRTSRPKQFIRALERLYKKYALNNNWGFSYEEED